tara:strand:- start:752 stop:1294 length:543 start_codon:yes stop_codon:yes gene_type:complete
MALTISKDSDCTQLIVTQTLLDSDDAIPAGATYELTVFKNCCDCTGYPVTIAFSANKPVASAGIYTIDDKVIKLEPGILGTGTTVFPDGVYKVVLTQIESGGAPITTESNCFFMDCSTTCEVAKYIKNLLKTPADVEAHLLHFGLVNGSNCNCNCDEMCSLYSKLYNILNNTETCLCNCT